MSQQLTISFKTGSPLNIEKLNRQNMSVFNHLMDGSRKKLNRYEAMVLYGIGDLHSRIPEVEEVLKEQFGITIKRQRIKVKNFAGEETSVNEYWLMPSDIDKINGFRNQVKEAA